MSASIGKVEWRHRVLLHDAGAFPGRYARRLRLTGLPRLACGFLLCCLLGCRTAAPYLHSSADRNAYAHLPPEERSLVDAGLLGFGMAKATVRLAWGNPQRKRTFTDQGKERTEWLYYGTRWVDQPTWEYTYTDRYGTRYLDFRMNRRGITFIRARAVFEGDQLMDWRQSSK